MKSITHDQFKALLNEQGVSSREHWAFICPACKTVQSMALLARNGVPADKLDTQIGFSCVGRWNGAGAPDFKGARPAKGKLGCNWTLGGLLRIHQLEVSDPRNDNVHPCFELASPEQAQALEKELTE